MLELHVTVMGAVACRHASLAKVVLISKLFNPASYTIGDPIYLWFHHSINTNWMKFSGMRLLLHDNTTPLAICDNTLTTGPVTVLNQPWLFNSYWQSIIKWPVNLCESHAEYLTNVSIYFVNYTEGNFLYDDMVAGRDKAWLDIIPTYYQ